MSTTLVLIIGALAAIGTFLVTSRVLTRIVLGFSLLGHAAVLSMLAAGGPAGQPPLADRTDGADSANPLPQALSLTAIVISFGLTLFLLALARRQNQQSQNDLVEDDVEDRRVARQSERDQVAIIGEPTLDGCDEPESASELPTADSES